MEFPSYFNSIRPGTISDLMSGGMCLYLGGSRSWYLLTARKERLINTPAQTPQNASCESRTGVGSRQRLKVANDESFTQQLSELLSQFHNTMKRDLLDISISPLYFYIYIHQSIVTHFYCRLLICSSNITNCSLY